MPRVPARSAQNANDLLRDVVRLFHQAQRSMTECCPDATRQECQALLLVGATETPLTVQEFAGRMGLEKTWASRLVARMEKRSLLRRVDHPVDGRSWLLELTAKGRREHRALEKSLNEHAVNLLACVPAAERANIERALGHLRDALQHCLAHCPPSRPPSC